MKKMKKVLFPFLLLFALTLGTISVMAADELLGTVVDGSLLTEELEAEGIAYPRVRGSYLSSGSGRITIAGTRQVNVTGNTSAYQKVDKIKVTLHLQRLKSGSWVHVTTLGPKTNTNANYVSNSQTYSVTGGYYYRVYGAHTVIENGSSEAMTSCTDGVWVS